MFVIIVVVLLRFRGVWLKKEKQLGNKFLKWHEHYYSRSHLSEDRLIRCTLNSHYIQNSMYLALLFPHAVHQADEKHQIRVVS